MKYLIALCCLFISINIASAFDGLAIYTTTISKGDYINPQGQKLTSARTILQQASANYCRRTGLTSVGSTDASFFCDPDKRNLFLNADIDMSSQTGDGIVSGKVRTVCVMVLTRYSMTVKPGSCK